jgi:hypothetical protein
MSLIVTLRRASYRQSVWAPRFLWLKTRVVLPILSKPLISSMSGCTLPYLAKMFLMITSFYVSYCNMRINNSVFSDITPCSPLIVNLHFGGTYCLHVQSRSISRARHQHDNFSWRRKYYCRYDGYEMP